MYVEYRKSRSARDDNGNRAVDDESRKKLEWVHRDWPIAKLHCPFNAE